MFESMDILTLTTYLDNKLGSTSSCPFDETTLVYKVGGKIFALFSEDKNPLRINLKCDPDEAQLLRGIHNSIIPGYHMNKEHWNTIILDGSLPDEMIFKLIDESYDIIVKKLKKAVRANLN